MIAIVDYGAGNLVSVKKAFDWLGQECAITSDPAGRERKQGCSSWRWPFRVDGVFGTDFGLQTAIAESITPGVPFLGICVGMQWMFSGSKESLKAMALACLTGNVSDSHRM